MRHRPLRPARMARPIVRVSAVLRRREISRNYSQTVPELCLNELARGSFDPIRERTEFVAITEKLEARVLKVRAGRYGPHAQADG